MYGTIESTHSKIMEKINNGLSATNTLMDVVQSQEITEIYKNLQHVEENYTLDIIDILSKYYDDTSQEDTITNEYYRIICKENFVNIINDILSKLLEVFINLSKNNDHSQELSQARKLVEYSIDIVIKSMFHKKNYELCKCGGRMNMIPEMSILNCLSCGKIKTIIGTIFRDDQCYMQDGYKTKHVGYDTSRHYRFHMERLQALENKVFPPEVINNMEYIINRDKYDRNSLNCEIIRKILKDPKVKSTKLNDHAPLLVKTLGGPSPPQLNFQENKIANIRFSKTMHLYDTVIPDGRNKPYYPYFIFKILEQLFKDDPVKIRILDYIHLQSRETVVKNDKTYEQICALSDNDDGLVYVPTDPARISNRNK